MTASNSVRPPIPRRDSLPQRAADLDRLERDADQRSDAALAGRPLAGKGGLRRGEAPGNGFTGLGAGRPLPPRLQQRLSGSLGVDLAAVRVYDDASARATTQELHAKAAVSGNQIVLGRDVDRPGAEQLIAHEVAHMAQTGDAAHLPAVLCDDGPGSRGIGRNPPEVEYATGSGLGPEDSHVLFEFDSAELTPGARASLREFARSQASAVTLDLYGYASNEGANDYNLNLSAHRALAVQRFLQPLLPESSPITLHAHGVLSQFEAAGDNRRVGINVREAATSDATPAQLPGLPRPAPHVSLGIGDLSLRTPIFGVPLSTTPGPQAGAQLADPDSDFSPDTGPDTAAQVPPPRLPTTFRLRLASPLTLQPQLAANLFQLPTFSPGYQIDYLPLARSAAGRGLHLPDLVANGELESAYALHRRLYPWIPEDPDTVDNWLGSKIVGAICAQAFVERTFDAHLSTEYPGIFEEGERQAQIFRMMNGQEEPFVIPPITILELQFDITPRGIKF